MKSKLPEGWREVKLGDIVELTMGQSPKSEFYNETGEGMPFMQGNTTFGEKYPTIERYTIKITRVAKKNDVLMSVRAPVGDLNICNIEQLCIGRGLCSIRMKNNMQEFLYFLMKYSMEKLESRESGTVFASVNKSDIQNLPVKLPPIKEQKSIADTLSSLDNKIEINNKINENLEKQAQAIFKHWFIDFEFPDKNGNPYKSSGGEMEESELGMIPKGWEVGTIADYSEVKSGYAFKSSWWKKHGVKVLKITNISSGKVTFDNCSYVDQEKIPKEERYIAYPGDLLIALTGATLGKMAIIPKLEETMLVNQRVGKFIYNEEFEYPLPFLYCLLSTGNITDEIIDRGQGSAQPNISPSSLGGIPILLPTIKHINKFNSITKPFFENYIYSYNQNQKLSQLRDTLLPKLMSGNIRILPEDNGGE